MPLPKPQITLRRPTVAPALAERFVTGQGIPSNLPAAGSLEENRSGERQRSEHHPLGNPGTPLRQVDVQTSGLLAVVGETLQDDNEHSDVQTSGPPGAQMLSAGIVQRRSGRIRRRTTVYFEPKLAKRLEIHCATFGVELSDFVEGAVRTEFEALQHRANGANEQAGQGRDAE